MLWRRFRYWAWNRRPAKVRAHLALQTLVSPNFCILHRAFHNHRSSNNLHNMFCYNMAMIVLRPFHVCIHMQKYCCRIEGIPSCPNKILGWLRANIWYLGVLIPGNTIIKVLQIDVGWMKKFKSYKIMLNESTESNI